MPTKYYDEKANARSQRYQSGHIRQIKFGFSIEYDADILEKLDSVQNKQGYIKDLIRADIARANSGKKEEEKKMTVYDFVRELRENDSIGVYDTPMDIETAKTDLANFAADGWDLPDDITPESYAAAWNELIRT